MSDEQTAEQTVREFLRCLSVPDADGAVRLLDPDVEWRNTGLPTLRGRRVIGMLMDLERRGIGVDIEVHHLAADGDVVLTDRTDVIKVGRWHNAFWVRGTFQLRDGRIAVWDDAFSWGGFLKGSVLGLGGLVRR